MKNTSIALPFLTSLSVLALFAFSAGHASAEGYHLLANVPTLPDQTPFTFAEYLQGLYVLIVGMGIVLSVVMLAVGGVEYIFASIPSAKNDGKARMVGALIGLLFILGSWILLGALNPKLLKGGLTIATINIFNTAAVNVPDDPGDNDCTSAGYTCAATCDGTVHGNLNDKCGNGEVCCEPAPNPCKDQGYTCAATCTGTAHTDLNNGCAAGETCCEQKQGTGSCARQSAAENKAMIQGTCVKLVGNGRVEGVRKAVIEEAIRLCSLCPGVPINIISAERHGGKGGATSCSHDNGYKMDIRITPELDACLKKEYGPNWDGSRGGAPGDRSNYYCGDGGVQYHRESGMWDIIVKCDNCSTSKCCNGRTGC